MVSTEDTEVEKVGTRRVEGLVNQHCCGKMEAKMREQGVMVIRRRGREGKVVRHNGSINASVLLDLVDGEWWELDWK